MNKIYIGYDPGTNECLAFTTNRAGVITERFVIDRKSDGRLTETQFWINPKPPPQAKTRFAGGAGTNDISPERELLISQLVAADDPRVNNLMNKGE